MKLIPTKLSQDFGVRALLGTIAGVGFYGTVFFILGRYELDLPTVIAIMGVAQAPWMLGLGFYFGTRVNPPAK